MKSAAFTYHRPSTVAEALALLAEHADDAKILAGGQSLLPMMGLRLARPAHLIDIGGLADELGAIDAGPDGVRIGALVRHAEAEVDEGIARHAPLVAAAMPHVGHRAIRTRGTVVGSIAHADPAAEMPAVCLALDATMVVASTEGRREVAAADFFDGYLTTAVADHELVVEVAFPAWPSSSGAALVELSRRHGDYALVGLACRIDVTDGFVTGAALSFLGVDSVPVRVGDAERSLVGRPPGEEAFADAAEIVSDRLSPPSDIHATAAYRRHAAGVLTRRGLAEAASTIGVPA
ncbi:MAG: xanthine dehydrogenase family protein subunit M [Actinomycetota bacterium]